MLDALKLHWLRSTVARKSRCVLALADEAAAAHFVSSRTWMGDCLRDLGIEVFVADLPDEVRERLLAAQKRQIRSHARASLGQAPYIPRLRAGYAD